jgi:hypothetical protein
LVLNDEGAEARNEFGLLPWEEAAVREFHGGEHAGNRTRSVMKVRPDLSYDTASVLGSIFFREKRVERFLQHLGRQVVQKAKKELEELLPSAVAVLDAAIRGEFGPKARLEISCLVVNKFIANKTEPVQVDFSTRVDEVIKNLSLVKDGARFGREKVA